jgi:hypothetical protein
MVFLATVDPSPRPQPMKFPVFSQLAGNLALQRRVRSRLPTSSRAVGRFSRKSRAISTSGRESGSPGIVISCNAAPIPVDESSTDDGRAAHAAAPDRPPVCCGR